MQKCHLQNKLFLSAWVCLCVHQDLKLKNVRLLLLFLFEKEKKLKN